MFFKSTKHRGFTLTEVLVVVTILVILGTALLVGIDPLFQIFRGYDTRRKADLFKLRNAFESYYVDHECYPSLDVLTQCNTGALDPYLASIPCDPQDGKPYSLVLTPANSVCPQQYAIYTNLLSPADEQLVYPECPQTLAVTSPGMSYIDLINACTLTAKLCSTYYGCKNGACVVVSFDSKPTCSKNYCESDCGSVNCGLVVRGVVINECLAF